ncbi:dihydrofolate reductase [uncultured Olsenella sp.]|uniref:dihydrofolate reductase n=1 Tax=uncultured Olsenella sp. TaxID=190764 RepID=UPI0026DD7A47|nr:dihydrofolate reductase [uncultured Olsenella sp.]
MNAIVSVTPSWGIGRDGALLVRNRADMRRFVELTMGGTVIMGRKTLQSFPGGPLRGRRNVVLTRGAGGLPEGVEVASGIEEALGLVADTTPDEVWLIGGQSVYQELLPWCERAYVTMNYVEAEADAWFPPLDEEPGWVLESREEGGVTAGGVPFEYLTYRQLEPRGLEGHD